MPAERLDRPPLYANDKSPAGGIQTGSSAGVSCAEDWASELD